MNEKDARVDGVPETPAGGSTAPTNGVAHTPGPWRYVPFGSRGKHYDIYGPRTEDLASVNGNDGGDEPEFYPSEANARLIAAAPDLLAALKLAEPIVALAYGRNPQYVSNSHALIGVRDAIAKAEGK
jgi:hypothetical protein